MPFTTTSHSLRMTLIASRVPRLYNTSSPFTMELRKVTTPFKMRSQREGWLCCARDNTFGVVGRESRSRFTWST
jgi:hypothetical protein